MIVNRRKQLKVFWSLFCSLHKTKGRLFSHIMGRPGNCVVATREKGTKQNENVNDKNAWAQWATDEYAWTDDVRYK